MCWLDTDVILSEVTASHGEAVTKSKDRIFARARDRHRKAFCLTDFAQRTPCMAVRQFDKHGLLRLRFRSQCERTTSLRMTTQSAELPCS